MATRVSAIAAFWRLNEISAEDRYVEQDGGLNGSGMNQPPRCITWDLLGTVAGFLYEPLAAKSRAKNGLSPDALALRLNVTQSENQYIRFGNPAARHVFRKGDVIVGIDGRKAPMSVREFLAYLLEEKERGEVVNLSLLRNGKRVTVKLAIP